MTQEQYRDRWSQLEASAVIDLGLTRSDFYSLTPRKMRVYTALTRARRQQDQYMVSQLTAVVANFSMTRPKEPFKAGDFMIELLEGAKRIAIEQPRMTATRRKSVASTLRSIFLGGMLGEVKRDG